MTKHTLKQCGFLQDIPVLKFQLHFLFLNLFKKYEYTRQECYTEEKQVEIGARLEHRLSNPCQTTTVWNTTAELCLLPYKIGQVQTITDATYD
jgi:hypothetical protein